MKLLGSPQQGLPVLHIAGSKGKGSTCAFVANILCAAGYKTGLYTSPHLVDVRERIRILQKPEKEIISTRDFARLMQKIRPYAQKLRKTKLGDLSYYEILTALAFLYFKEQACDFVVLETGVGGRLDATNLTSALVCCITPISYEHTQVLGSTLKKIAAEKAGIIKDRSQVVVTAPQRPSVLKVIRKRAKKCGAILFEVGTDVAIKKGAFSLTGQVFDVQGAFGEYAGLKIKLLGQHQIINAATALTCVEALRRYGTEISQAAIREGLKQTDWPGRLQLISRRPRIVLDGAHNRASASALKDALTTFFKFHNLILVFGVSRDKDVKGILKEILPLSSRIILTKTKNPRALAPQAIKGLIKTDEKTVILTSDPTQALNTAIKAAGSKDLILVCGSLFLLGDILSRSSSGTRAYGGNYCGFKN